MKKFLLLLVLLPLLAVAGFAQESRQDISLSGTGLLQQLVAGDGVQVHATVGYGGLLSYRYMLTPRSALELNYQYAQDTEHFVIPTNSVLVHPRFMEVSGAYVYNFTYKNFNPFLEVGVGDYRFIPIGDAKTQSLDLKSSSSIGALYGGGIAYELSPSFDLRLEYRGIVLQTPTYGQADFKTNAYYNLNNPTIGIAYHF